ncbi:alpha-L-glutamate ligase-like protein [Aquisalimonas sp.]|uniref:alpha-L-glutamate ligase-like protein n=1 Tax=unclassified Aquisalimonas TaxID=2644645 RepID=UPI0025C1A41F|nr:alpha-L-glutamate ligase-like protein [Aquisalimonas sp.]
MIGFLRRVREAEVLGMNRRNAEFIMAYNARRNYPFVDDKLRSKKLAEEAGIQVPALYGTIEIERQIRQLPDILAGRDDFVIKPAHGSGGSGILVVAGSQHGRYRRASGTLMDQRDVDHHVSNILSGMHSLGGQPDCALIEQRVQFAPLFDDISYRGVPDIRTVVFRGVPVMAMVRLPTRRSDGKANLHQGAVGAGLDIGTGRTTTAVCLDRDISEHPDTGAPIAGIQIPDWHNLLILAARCHSLAQLGYLGVDIVLDRIQGPLMLELNARPGLSIQLANRTSLLRRLRRIEALETIPDDADGRVALARELFVETPD